MKYILCCLSLFFLNCENKTTSKKGNTTKVQTITEVKDSLKTDSITHPQREFPLLSEDNAMDFFMDYEKHNKEDQVRITTDYGIIEIKLYDKTKFHRANFIFLTKQGYFNNTQFYRVVNNFIIQGGNTDDPKVKRKRKTIGKYLLPKDTRHGYKHERGVISMPSSDIDNPHKLASPYEFFIVQRPGGSYHLDGNYTAFGKVTKGMDIVDEIAKQETDNAEWPLHNIYIRKVEIIN